MRKRVGTANREEPLCSRTARKVRVENVPGLLPISHESCEAPRAIGHTEGAAEGHGTREQKTKLRSCRQAFSGLRSHRRGCGSSRQPCSAGDQRPGAHSRHSTLRVALKHNKTHTGKVRVRLGSSGGASLGAEARLPRSPATGAAGQHPAPGCTEHRVLGLED